MIRAAGLGKKFKIYPRPWGRLTEWLTLGRATRHDDFWALRDVSFDVARGESLGVIGVNGSGKSTLLKILSGAMYPTEGTFDVGGRVLSLLELGTGLNPQLTGRQNVVNSARLLAFPPDYASEKLPQIEAFAELRRLLRPPGAALQQRHARPARVQHVRLLRPGRVRRRRGPQRRRRLLPAEVRTAHRADARAGTTMLFVSHDMQLVRRLCERVLLLSHGRPAFLGPADEAVSRYYSSLGTGAAPSAERGLGRGACARRKRLSRGRRAT